MYVLSVCGCVSAPTVAPSGLGGGGGDRNELIITWTVSLQCSYILSIISCIDFVSCIYMY